jgi:hypothetical protein
MSEPVEEVAAALTAPLELALPGETREVLALGLADRMPALVARSRKELR